MAALFGPTWVRSFGGSVDPEGEWLATLQGLTDAQIDCGLAAVRRSGSGWPPAAPVFRDMCLPNADSLGLPSEAEAYHMVCQATNNTAGPGHWRNAHTVVYYAYKQLDAFRFQRANATEHRSMFNEAYRLAVAKAAAGYLFPPVPLALEQTKPPPTDEEKAQQRKERRAGPGKILAEHWP